jgi:hypothetical protein
MRSVLLIAMLAVPAMTLAQTPEIFDVGDVVAGAHRIETRYFFSTGKWSDDPKDSGSTSVEIHCYKAFAFCEVAHSYMLGGQAWVALNEYDILRWDSDEMFAVDSSAICVVNNLRADFRAKKVSISSTSKGVVGDAFCKTMDADPRNFKTAFLLGLKDQLNQMSHEKAGKK